jgi:hypothetical protein
MILYIHGFGSSGQGSKASVFRSRLNDQNFVAPSLSIVPDLAISTLCELIEAFGKYDKVSLIGSSLGGYYAIYLAHRYNIQAVLINPSIYPYNTLEKALGHVPNYYDLSSFEWRETHLTILKNYEVATPNPKNYLLLLQKGDELLDYREAIAKFPTATHIVEEGGDHSFIGIERYMERIKEFLNKDL